MSQYGNLFTANGNTSVPRPPTGGGSSATSVINIASAHERHDHPWNSFPSPAGTSVISGRGGSSGGGGGGVSLASAREIALCGDNNLKQPHSLDASSLVGGNNNPHLQHQQGNFVAPASPNANRRAYGHSVIGSGNPLSPVGSRHLDYNSSAAEIGVLRGDPNGNLQHQQQQQLLLQHQQQLIAAQRLHHHQQQQQQQSPFLLPQPQQNPLSPAWQGARLPTTPSSTPSPASLNPLDTQAQRQLSFAYLAAVDGARNRIAGNRSASSADHFAPLDQQQQRSASFHSPPLAQTVSGTHQPALVSPPHSWPKLPPLASPQSISGISNPPDSASFASLHHQQLELQQHQLQLEQRQRALYQQQLQRNGDQQLRAARQNQLLHSQYLLGSPAYTKDCSASSSDYPLRPRDDSAAASALSTIGANMMATAAVASDPNRSALQRLPTSSSGMPLSHSGQPTHPLLQHHSSGLSASSGPGPGGPNQPNSPRGLSLAQQQLVASNANGSGGFQFSQQLPHLNNQPHFSEPDNHQQNKGNTDYGGLMGLSQVAAAAGALSPRGCFASGGGSLPGANKLLSPRANTHPSLLDSCYGVNNIDSLGRLNPSGNNYHGVVSQQSQLGCSTGGNLGGLHQRYASSLELPAGPMTSADPMVALAAAAAVCQNNEGLGGEGISGTPLSPSAKQLPHTPIAQRISIPQSSSSSSDCLSAMNLGTAHTDLPSFSSLAGGSLGNGSDSVARQGGHHSLEDLMAIVNGNSGSGQSGQFSFLSPGSGKGGSSVSDVANISTSLHHSMSAGNLQLAADSRDMLSPYQQQLEIATSVSMSGGDAHLYNQSAALVGGSEAHSAFTSPTEAERRVSELIDRIEEQKRQLEQQAREQSLLQTRQNSLKDAASIADATEKLPTGASLDQIQQYQQISPPQQSSSSSSGEGNGHRDSSPPALSGCLNEMVSSPLPAPVATAALSPQDVAAISQHDMDAPAGRGKECDSNDRIVLPSASGSDNESGSVEDRPATLHEASSLATNHNENSIPSSSPRVTTTIVKQESSESENNTERQTPHVSEEFATVESELRVNHPATPLNNPETTIDKDGLPANPNTGDRPIKLDIDAITNGPDESVSEHDKGAHSSDVAVGEAAEESSEAAKQVVDEESPGNMKEDGKDYKNSTPATSDQFPTGEHQQIVKTETESLPNNANVSDQRSPSASNRGFVEYDRGMVDTARSDNAQLYSEHQLGSSRSRSYEDIACESVTAGLTASLRSAVDLAKQASLLSAANAAQYLSNAQKAAAALTHQQNLSSSSFGNFPPHVATSQSPNDSISRFRSPSSLLSPNSGPLPLPHTASSGSFASLLGPLGSPPNSARLMAGAANSLSSLRVQQSKRDVELFCGELVSPRLGPAQPQLHQPSSMPSPASSLPPIRSPLNFRAGSSASMAGGQHHHSDSLLLQSQESLLSGMMLSPRGSGSTLLPAHSSQHQIRGPAGEVGVLSHLATPAGFMHPHNSQFTSPSSEPQQHPLASLHHQGASIVSGAMPANSSVYSSSA